MRPVHVVCTVVVVGLAGCSRTSSIPNDATNSSFASYDAGAVPGGPGAKQSYALGHAAADSAIAAMNQDIGPDGAELPAGRGTVARGVVVYAAQCSQCHGAKGEGLPTFPKLVGRDSAGAPKPEFQFATTNKTKTIGNYWPYATTLFDYVRRSMPIDKPLSLTSDEVYAVSAYVLFVNGIVGEDTQMNARSLPQVKMPNRDGFISDWPGRAAR